MNKLTPEQLVLLNRKLTESASEEKLLKMDIGEFEEMANIPYRKDKELFYEYNSTLKKAAVLGHLIVKREPFRKSNKETAVLALLTLGPITLCGGDCPGPCRMFSSISGFC